MKYLTQVDLSGIVQDASIFTTRMPDKPFFTPREAGKVLQYSSEVVRQMCQSKELLCFIHNKNNSKARTRYRIPREALILYLMKRANFSDEDFIGLARQMFRDLSPELRARITYHG